MFYKITNTFPSNVLVNVFLSRPSLMCIVLGWRNCDLFSFLRGSWDGLGADFIQIYYFTALNWNCHLLQPIYTASLDHLLQYHNNSDAIEMIGCMVWGLFMVVWQQNYSIMIKLVCYRERSSYKRPHAFMQRSIPSRK